MGVIYKIGDQARLAATFVNLAGNPANPDTVTLLVQAPDNSQSLISTLPPIVHDSTGNYHYDLTITQSGPDAINPAYLYRWSGSGGTANVYDVVEGSIVVAPTLLVPQPVAVPQWTRADLDAINAAIASGAKEVRFADRTITYRNMTELLQARTAIALAIGIVTNPIRQIRTFTNKGWGL